MPAVHTDAMELTVWRTFVTVCRLGSLSAAAAELNHTQSAVSRQIAGLERQLGVPLVERHARGVRPTPAGEVFRLWSTSCGRVTLGYANRTRLRRSSNPARPNIWRLSILIRLT
jgi:hypothetical protein